MAKTTIVLGNGELDISKEIGISLQYSLGEVQNPEKRSSNYSKSILLPGTKNNNKLLGNLFDVNQDFTFFNPNIKTEAKIVLDSTTVIDGYLQLVSIDKLNNTDLNSNNIQYRVTVFDETVDFFTAIGDKLLSELDFSDYNHTLTKSEITNSWISRTPNDIYTYPIMWKNSDLYKTGDFKPAIYHKAYLLAIAEANGFNLSGTFLDNPTYNKEIIPFAAGQVVISDAELLRRRFRAGLTASTDLLYSSELLGGLANSNGANLDSGSLGFTSFDNDSTAPNFDSDNHYNTTTNTYTLDTTGSFNIEGHFYIDVEFTTERVIGAIADAGGGEINITSTAHNLTSGATVTILGTTSYNGTYIITYVDANTFKVTATFVANEAGTYGVDAYQSTYAIASQNNNPIESGGYSNYAHKYFLEISFFVNGVKKQVYKTTPRVVPRGAAGTTNVALDSSNNFTQTFNEYINLNRAGVNYQTGDEITLSFKVVDDTNNLYNLKYTQNSSKSSDSVPVDVTYTINKTYNGFNSRLENYSNGGKLTDNDIVELNAYIHPKAKQKDIILDIIKRYNVYISKGLNNSKELVLDSRDDYFNKGGVLDWTNKKDYSNPDTIKLISEIQNKELEFTYSEGKDDWNESYTKSVAGDIYGEKTIVFDNEFTKGTKKVQTPFSATPLIYNSPNQVMVVPAIGTSSDYDKLKVLYFDGTIPTIGGKFWRFEWLNGTTVTTTNYVDFPYSGHYDNPFTPTNDINFGQLPYTMYSELTQLTDSTLYNNYWVNYVNQMAEGKLVTSKFNLSEVDISFIKDNLNTKIFVKDSYYYINKIKDYNPVVKGLTTVELLKIVDGVSFIPTEEDTEPVYNRWESTDLAPIYNDADDSRDSVVQAEGANATGSNNYIGQGSDDAIISGTDNEIGSYSPYTGILGGSNNIIYSRVSNSFIIGSTNKVVTQDNEIWVGDIHIVDGYIQSDFNVIEGGENEISNLYPTSLINMIDGGEDEIRGFNSQNLQNLVEGGENKV